MKVNSRAKENIVIALMMLAETDLDKRIKSKIALSVRFSCKIIIAKEVFKRPFVRKVFSILFAIVRLR